MKCFAFRLDANARIGTGHLMRCLTIANELDKNIYSCHFICSELIQSIRSLIADKGYKYYLEDNEDGVLTILKNINPQNIPHMLIYGPPGSGKKSILYSFLGYGKKLKISKKIKTSSKEIPFTKYWNDTYVEFDIKEMGMYGKFIIRDIIQQFAETRQLIDNKKHKIVVLHHIEMLTVESQYILNKIIETNMVNCKFILISNTLGNIINPLRSCCLPLRINALSNEEIKEYVSELNKKSNINLSGDQITKIVNTCGRNCKKAVLNLETYSLIKSHKVTLNHTKIDNIVKLILKKRITLNVISKITTYLYEFIMDNNISSNYILLEIS